MGILHVQCFEKGGNIFENVIFDKDEIKLIYSQRNSLEIHFKHGANLSYIGHKILSSSINSIIIDIMKEKNINSILKLYYKEIDSENRVSYICYDGKIREQIIL